MKTEVLMCAGGCWASWCHREEPVYSTALGCVRLVGTEPPHSPLRGSERASCVHRGSIDHFSVFLNLTEMFLAL